MALNHNDVELPELIINHFDTLADYQAAYQAGFISGTDITFIDENIQADWDETDSGSPAYIKNKPVISGGGTSVQSNWAQNDPSAADYIKNKPTITSVSGTNDGTNWTTITIGNTTKNIPSGGGGGGSSTLAGLTDTTISSPSSGQILAYDSSTSKWVNTTEKDPTVPAWAKAANKPSYTASEVGALATGTTLDNIPDGSTRKLSNFISSSNTVSALDTKVDKVSGKALSTNDFSDAYKGKLDNIASGADVNVQADWAETGTTNDAYIKNKPTIPNGIATSAVSGYMSAEMVSKLDDAASVLWCKITRGTRIDDYHINCTVDKTHDEIVSAMNAGKIIMGYTYIFGELDIYRDFYVCRLCGQTSSQGRIIEFIRLDSGINDSNTIWWFSADKVSYVNSTEGWILTQPYIDNSTPTIDLSMDSTTFVMSASLLNSYGEVVSYDTVDLPLETMVVGGHYNSGTQKVVLELKSGSTVEFSVADLVSGLVNETTFNNHVASGSHVTTDQKNTWNGKQDAINDLSQIRTNAASGWSAYQTVTAHTGSTTVHLPSVTQSDSGKILQVSSAGTWQLVSPVTIYSGTGTPAQNLGKDGDIYIQTT